MVTGWGGGNATVVPAYGVVDFTGGMDTTVPLDLRPVTVPPVVSAFPEGSLGLGGAIVESVFLGVEGKPPKTLHLLEITLVVSMIQYHNEEPYWEVS